MNGHRPENSCLQSVFLLVLSLSACVQGCGGSSNGSDDGPSLRECPEFTNIVKGTFARDGDELTWTLELEAMPERFLLNQTEVPDNGGEYGWEVELDGDGDGVHELSVSVQRFKFAGNPQEWTSDILSATQHDVWQAQGDSAHRIGTPYVLLEGNSFVFAASARQIVALASVTSPEQCIWQARFWYGSSIEESCHDEWRPGD